MQTIKASEFKAKCLSLMDQVNETQEEIVITKNGKPVSKLVPFHKPFTSIYGMYKGQIHYDKDDDLFSTGVVWDAEK